MAHPLEELLSPGARNALARARATPMSYAYNLYACPSAAGAPPRILAVLGEAHVKLGPAAVLGRELVTNFELRGVETFQIKRVLWGRLLGALIHGPRQLLRFASLGLVEGSTIVEAKQLRFGNTVEIEDAPEMPFPLHVASVYLSLFFLVSFAHLAFTIVSSVLPDAAGALDAPMSWLTLLALAFQAHMITIVPAWFLRKHSWAWLVHPAIAIISVRDGLMANGTVRMLANHPDVRSAIVVMGRAHLPGYGLELEKRGFQRLET